MRLLNVTHFYEAHGGGIERVVGQLSRALSRRGVAVSWAASDQDPAPGAPVFSLPLRCANPIERITGLPMPIPGLQSIRRLLKGVEASDGVIIHDALYVTSIVAMLAARRAGKRTILIQHIAAIPFSSSLLRGLMALANRIVTRRMLRAADEVVFISDTVRRDLLGEQPWRDFTLAFNGVDHATFHRADGSDVAQPGPARALFVGRYVEKKGLAVLRELGRLRPDLTIRLAGRGSMAPRQWSLPNVIDLGQLSPHELAQEYRAADVLILPSVGEGYPLVIQEALACGTGVVCGIPADRADPEASAFIEGVTIDLGDPTASAARCAEAIDRIDRSNAARALRAEFAASRYSWDTMAATVLSLARREAD